MPEDNLSRRDVLGMIGSSTAIASGIGAASAEPAEDSEKLINDQLAEQYTSDSQVRRVVEQEASAVLKELADRDIIEHASVAVFNFGDQSSGNSSSSTVTQITTKDGEDTAFIQLEREDAAYYVTLTVQPEADRSYAQVTDKETGEEFAIDPTADSVKLPAANETDDGVTTQDHCSDHWACTDNICLQQNCGTTKICCYKQRIYYECYHDPSSGTCDCYESDTSCDSGGYHCDINC